jgi:hypothetical protein
VTIGVAAEDGHAEREIELVKEKPETAARHHS